MTVIEFLICYCSPNFNKIGPRFGIQTSGSRVICYAYDGQTNRRTDGQKQTAPFPTGGGIIIIRITPQKAHPWVTREVHRTCLYNVRPKPKFWPTGPNEYRSSTELRPNISVLLQVFDNTMNTLQFHQNTTLQLYNVYGLCAVPH